jgi:hypothetical protein
MLPYQRLLDVGCGDDMFGRLVKSYTKGIGNIRFAGIDWAGRFDGTYKIDFDDHEELQECLSLEKPNWTSALFTLRNSKDPPLVAQILREYTRDAMVVLEHDPSRKATSPGWMLRPGDFDRFDKLLVMEKAWMGVWYVSNA